MIHRARQRRLLARTFFHRLFESDLMPAAFPQERLLISGIAGIAIPLTLLPLSMRATGPLMIFIQYTMAMIALAFVALLIWEGIFPDRRDARILSVLPIHTTTFVVARLAALAALFGLCAAGAAVLPSLAFTPIGNPFVHFVGFVGIGAAAFFSIVCVQCILLNVVGRAAAQRLAIALQVLLVVTILQAPSIAPPPDFLFAGGDVGSGPASWMPSIWFLSLYEVLTGRQEPHLMSLALRAVVAAIGMPLAATLLYAATYRRLVRRAIEGERAASRAKSVLTIVPAVGGRLLSLVVPGPLAHAVCLFTLKTLARSRRHKMLLAMYVGVALAIALSVIVPRAVRDGMQGFVRPDPSLLALPLVFLFFGLVGFRAVINIPIEISANWVFRLREAHDRDAVARGVAAAMTAAVIVPVTLLAFAAAAMLWGGGAAIRHAAFCGAMGLLLLHALLLRLRKVPFTCTYFPGASRVKYLWPLYVFGFTIYAWAMGRVQRNMLLAGSGFAQFIVVVLIITAILVVLRRWHLRSATGLLFEGQDPDQVAFEGFSLSEGLAAAAKPAGAKAPGLRT